MGYLNPIEIHGLRNVRARRAAQPASTASLIVDLPPEESARSADASARSGLATDLPGRRPTTAGRRLRRSAPRRGFSLLCVVRRHHRRRPARASTRCGRASRPMKRESTTAGRRRFRHTRRGIGGAIGEIRRRRRRRQRAGRATGRSETRQRCASARFLQPIRPRSMPSTRLRIAALSRHSDERPRRRIRRQ